MSTDDNFVIIISFGIIYNIDAYVIPINELEIYDKLGFGGYGTVWSAKWNDLPVAIKMCEQMELVDEFKKEVRHRC